MKFLLGGRLGDLIHSLYVVKNTPGKHDLYITDDRNLHSDGFLLSLEETYIELQPILTKQSWCNTFQIYTGGEVTNLSLWRRYAYTSSWTKLLSNTFNVPAVEGSWIKLDKIPGWKEKIVIHCSTNPSRRGQGWEMLLDKYEHRTIFVGSEAEYRKFRFQIPFYNPNSLLEYFQIINSCKYFIGNQSAPLAMAHALDVPRLGILNKTDEIHYIGEEKFSKNFCWMSNNNFFFEGINY